MRQLPDDIKAALAERWQVIANDADPRMKIISTQLSYNTLLSEEVHADNKITNYGDATVHYNTKIAQPDFALVACLDNQYINAYKRLFPAEYNLIWKHILTFSQGGSNVEALDVAIEYDGVWAKDNTADFFHLNTEDWPWLFWVDTSNVLWGQHWTDEATTIQLATGVSQISACKCWHAADQNGNDQGLIIAYLKNGTPYYRSYCVENDGSHSWETETQIASFGTACKTIQVFRTNDYRAGFISEYADGTMNWVVTDRMYAGFAFRPETITAGYKNLSFKFIPIDHIYKQSSETISASYAKRFCWLQLTTSAALSIVSSTRVSTTEFKVTFNDDLVNAQNLQPSSVTVTASGGSAVTVNSISYAADSKTLDITIPTANAIARNITVTIAIIATRDVGFYVYEQQISPFTAVSTNIAAEVTTSYYTVNEQAFTVTQRLKTLALVAITYHNAFESATITAGYANVKPVLKKIGTSII